MYLQEIKLSVYGGPGALARSRNYLFVPVCTCVLGRPTVPSVYGTVRAVDHADCGGTCHTHISP